MADHLPLADRIALVTEGAHGVGPGITEALIAAGARVAVSGRSQPDELPGGARWFAADLREVEQVDALVAAVVEHHGRLDVVVTGLVGAPPADAATASPAFTEEILELNLLAPLRVATAANRVLQGQDEGGAIVLVGSTLGMQPAPRAAAYGAAAAGLVSLTQSLAVEWAPRVRVNALALGHVEGDAVTTNPLGRAGTAADVGSAVVHLASPASSYVTGANLVVHGGDDRPAYLSAITGD
jgi:NAD(P)-dependent dehydrogenase (short-subunit alcohol dehydrogenase family)